jgi:hypothetical protein
MFECSFFTNGIFLLKSVFITHDKDVAEIQKSLVEEDLEEHGYMNVVGYLGKAVTSA